MRTKIALLALVAFASCGNCSDDNSQTSEQPPTKACSDFDEDGHELGPDCEESTDCNDSDPTTYEGAEELCGDGRDNDCDNDIDEGCEVEGGCVAGATRPCGEDVGRCTVGEQTCEAGEWSDCDGTRPTSESCNGEDDDCDGEIDENGIDLCDDGLVCNGVSTCESGACTEPEELDCTMLNGPCTAGTCSEKDRGCKAAPIANGTACDDGMFCTENGSCSAGECVTTPRDCSAEEDGCNIGVCDEAAAACVKQPKSDGVTCDDTLYCTTGDSCTAGVCGGAARDCSSAADQCNSGVCDDTVDACVPAPIADGTACDDTAYCNVGETCQAGACTGGLARDCSAQGGSCRTGACNEVTDACDGPPVPDGTACDDSLFCSTNDSCVAGTCMGGGPRDCSSADGTCRIGTCSEALNLCTPAPAPNGTTCDDGLFCTQADVCTSGACGGMTRNCAAAGGECSIGTCDEAVDACVGQPASDGSACPDSLFCTQNEVCLAGTCNRAPRDCSASGDVCNDGICDETADACAAAPKPNGTACTDGLFCTTNDACIVGVCTGGPTSCTQLDDECTVGSCDETANTCMGAARPDNTPCDDSAFCTEMDSCSGGVCTGAARNCSAAGDQCNTGICDEVADMCVGLPLADATPCSDGLYCTSPDQCTAGVCGGPARSCAALDDDCVTGVCNEASDSCVPQNLPNGTTCTLPAYCLVNTTCSSGACIGAMRDCSGAPMGDMCLDGLCDENVNMCITVDNGTCNICDTGRPTANAGIDETVVPNTTVTLNGTGSTDPTGQALTYSWSFQTRPTGSSATISNTSSVTPTFLADVAGTYVACLVVTDTDSCVSDPAADPFDCVTITVVPVVDLHIELVWFSDESDMDVHYQAPNYAATKWFTSPTVFFNSTNPDWGAGTGDTPDGIGTNDPSLDVDNRTGFGPENINQAGLFDGDPFTIGVHFYSNTDTTLEPITGPTDARIRVYESGNLIFERTRNLRCQDFWEVGEVQVSNGGMTVNVVQKNSVTTRDLAGGPYCRCNSDSDCNVSGETCKSFRLAGGGPPRFADLCAP